MGEATLFDCEIGNEKSDETPRVFSHARSFVSLYLHAAVLSSMLKSASYIKVAGSRLAQSLSYNNLLACLHGQIKQYQQAEMERSLYEYSLLAR